MNTPEPTRRATADTEIVATPEQIWEAIATGPGNDGWNFPTSIEGTEGGAIRIDRGEHGVAEGTITAWEPPHRIAYTTGDFATEILVEARSGGTCLVRVVDTFSGDLGGWEDMVDLVGQGWRMALLILRGYVSHFAGQPVATLEAGGTFTRDRETFSAELHDALGLTGLDVGDLFRASDGTPPLAGVVEGAMDHFIQLRTTEPGPGLFHVAAMPMSPDTVTGGISARLYGPEAEAVAAREQPRWADWFARLPQ